MLTPHNELLPDRCTTCGYIRDHPDADFRLEHTMEWTAAAIIVLDLKALGQPRAFQAIATRSIGEPGPPTSIDPRHWFWAPYDEPRFLISLDSPEEGRPG